MIALGAFCTEIWRIWRDRPRNSCYVSAIKYANVPDVGDIEMARFRAINVGYRPVIITEFFAFGKRSMSHNSAIDELSYIVREFDQKLPFLLEPGARLDFHPYTVSAIKRNSTDPMDPKVFFDPWRYFVFVDSFGKNHFLDADEVRSELGISQKKHWHSRKTLIERASRSIQGHIALQKIRKRFRNLGV